MMMMAVGAMWRAGETPKKEAKEELPVLLGRDRITATSGILSRP